MLKKKAFKKLSLVICCLLIVGIILVFPKDTNNSFMISSIKDTGYIYLLDDDDYLARVNYRYNGTNNKDIIKEMIKILTINNDIIPIEKGFKSIIPENTKLLELNIRDNIAILNFSKELLNVSKKYEEKMIEALIYSITTINDIKGIKILVQGNVLEYLPYSKKRLDNILTRDFKINKEYDIKNMSNITTTTIYYLANKNDYIYYKPVTKYSNTEKEKIEIIIDELKSSSIYSTNLISFINEETKLINYEILDKSLLLNFDNAILNDINNNNIIEEVTYAINMSIKENYDVESVSYYINDNIFGTYFLFLG